ncbi:MAG: adenylate/guanylate cyclase domain-containing protein [Planctomycetota bacterium]
MSLFRLTIKSRFVLIMLTLSAIACVSLCLIAYRSMRAAIRERVVNQLNSVRDSRAAQVETYIAGLRGHVAALTEDLTVIEATKEFSEAILDDAASMTLGDGEIEKLESFYREQVLPELIVPGDGDPVLQSYLPPSAVGRFLQYHYLENNQRKPDEDSGDESAYAKTHRKYDRHFERLISVFGYSNLCLVDTRTSDIVYSVAKRIDFATNLKSGPHSSTALGMAVQAAVQSANREFVALQDFQFYVPSGGQPSAFVAGPIFDGSEKVGIIAVEFPINAINRIMTVGGQWEPSGLGETGESFLVGGDRTMRSDARRLLEDHTDYVNSLATTSLSEGTINRIKHLNTTALIRPVENIAVDQAMKGKTGVAHTEHLLGYESICSYRPLELEGVRWCVIAEMETAEAFASLSELRRLMFLSSAGLMLITTCLAMLISAHMTRPIETFIEDSRQVVQGKKDWLSVRAGDEFGVLAYEINKMVGGLRNETERVSKDVDGLDQLLTHLVPEHVAVRMKQGDEQIITSHTNVSVMTARWKDNLDEHGRQGSTEEFVGNLNALVGMLDAIVDEHPVEKVKSDGATYTVTCGVSVPRLDHARRVVDFAKAVQNELRIFNRQHDASICVRIGVDCGSVVSGVIGTRNVIYDVWGPPVDVARRITQTCPTDDICVSSRIADTLRDSTDLRLQPVDPSASPEDDVWKVQPNVAGSFSASEIEA